MVVHPLYKGDKLFDLNDLTLNRDNCLLPFVLLKQNFLNKGIQLCAVEEGEEKEFPIVIYNEMPSTCVNTNISQARYLMVFESELIIPKNWDKKLHKDFKYIFTWHDDFVHGEKYIKFNFPQNITNNLTFSDIKKPKFCTLIAGNKKVSHSLELYSEREKAIHWFENNYPEQFDLYGIGWDEFVSTNKFLNRFFRFLKLSKVFATHHPCYKGRVESKNTILKSYKFSICYENAKDIPGYITEKIFDCFFAGCVPVYWGANNVSAHIPQSCFIDKRDFPTYEQLYSYMVNLSEKEYQEYQYNIAEFLKSEQAKVFSAEYFAENIVQIVTKDIDSE